MSIDSDLQPVASITEGDRALDLFTDRYSFTRLLAERLNDPPREEILFFHGAGGNGKSLLLQYLQKKICKQLASGQWQQLKDCDDDELATTVAALDPSQDACFSVPTALLDFASGSSSSSRPNTESFYGLAGLREALMASTKITPFSLEFPLHTYGCFLYLQKTNRLGELEGLFPADEAEFIGELIGLFREIPGLGLVLSGLTLADKRLGGRVARYRKRFGIDKVLIERLEAMDPEKELIPMLPMLFAQDLKVAMAKSDAPGRVVLFFDTQEAFYGADRNRSTNFFRDGWLRRLLRQLKNTPKVVVVVAGRDIPRWAEADEYEPDTAIETDQVCLVSVDSLAASDADIFLRKAGIKDRELRKSLIHYASEQENVVHPLHLGLCADVALEAKKKGEALELGDFSELPEFRKKSRRLIRKLLWYVDDELEDAIRALSACRAFDFEIYQLLGKKLSFSTDRAAFQRLVGFSFIRQVVQQGKEQYRIHDLLRRLGDKSEMMLAHEILAQYYESQGDVEQIYHTNQIDWKVGVSQWIEAFEQALELSQYLECRALLELQQDLTIQTSLTEGLFSYFDGRYFQELAIHDVAVQSYEESIRSFRKSLLYECESVVALNYEGMALQNLAKIQTVLSQHEAAKRNCKEAITAYDKALNKVPNDIQTFNNKGNSLKGLAELQVLVAQYVKAQGSYRQAISTYNKALEQTPEFVHALNNKGVSLKGLADLQVMLSKYREAKESYKKSISAYNISLQKAPNDVSMLHNKGFSLTGLADLYRLLSENELARESYSESITYYDAVLQRAPDYIDALNNRGTSLKNLANLQTALSEYEMAWKSYGDSIASYEMALELAPNYVPAIVNTGNALMSLADLQILMTEYSAAEEMYVRSIAAYDNALTIAPSSSQALNNKGALFRKLADLQVRLFDLEQARGHYKKSIDIFDTVLQQAPNLTVAITNKGVSLQSMANLQMTLDERDTAWNSYRAALQLFSQALDFTPNDPQIRLLFENLTYFLSAESE